MSAQMTISIRSVVLTVVAVSALVAAYVIGTARGDAVTPSAAAAPTNVTVAAPAKTADEPAMVVTGTGEATGVPDQMRFSLSVHTDAADVSGALRQANAAARRAIGALREQGVRRRDVQTTGLSVRPQYQYSDGAPPVIVGYAASQRLSVLVRSLADAGSTISAAAAAGGNAVRLNGLRLEIGDRDALMRRARQAAVAEATEKAEQYAEASGRQLDEITSLREVGPEPTGRPRFQSLRATAGDISSVPIKAGSEELKVTVALVWTFTG